MSVDVELAEPLAGWEGVRSALAEIQGSAGDFERFFGEVFEQLEWMSAELAAREQWLAQSALRAPVPPPAPPEENPGITERWLEQLRQQHAELRSAEEAMQRQAACLAAAAAELNLFGRQWGEIREELTAVRKELLQQTQQWAEAQRQPAEEPLQEQLRQMTQQQALLEQQRTAVEAELDAVRGRAAETAEALAEHQRLLRRQQAEWAEELKRIRRLVETMPDRLAEGLSAADVPKADRSRKEAQAAPAGSNDPVLGSVMAQFEILQRDMARRRTGST